MGALLLLALLVCFLIFVYNNSGEQTDESEAPTLTDKEWANSPEEESPAYTESNAPGVAYVDDADTAAGWILGFLVMLIFLPFFFPVIIGVMLIGGLFWLIGRALDL